MTDQPSLPFAMPEKGYDFSRLRFHRIDIGRDGYAWAFLNPHRGKTGKVRPENMRTDFVIQLNRSKNKPDINQRETLDRARQALESAMKSEAMPRCAIIGPVEEGGNLRLTIRTDAAIWHKSNRQVSAFEQHVDEIERGIESHLKGIVQSDKMLPTQERMVLSEGMTESEFGGTIALKSRITEIETDDGQKKPAVLLHCVIADSEQINTRLEAIPDDRLLKDRARNMKPEQMGKAAQKMRAQQARAAKEAMHKAWRKYLQNVLPKAEGLQIKCAHTPYLRTTIMQPCATSEEAQQLFASLRGQVQEHLPRFNRLYAKERCQSQQEQQQR